MEIETQIMNVLLLGSIVGFIVILFTTLTILPASFMMNKFIHHSVGMRWLMGIVGVLLGIFVLVYSMVMSVVFRKNVYYFGLFPSYIPMTIPMTGGSATPLPVVPGPAESWLSRIYEIVLQFASPFSIITDMFTIENFTLEDSNSYRAFRDHIKTTYEGHPTAPRFDVDLMERVKDAGRQSALDAWSGAMKDLGPECRNMFAPTR